MLQIEIPHLAKAPSVKALVDAFINQHKRFSFSSTSSHKVFDGKVRVNPSDASSHGPVPVSPEDEQKQVIANITSFLEGIVVEDLPEARSCFIGSAIPPISLGDYLERLVKYANQWAEDKPSATSTGIRCLLIALEFLLRSKARLTPHSIHRYVMTAVLLAIKTTEDFAISNKFWGDVGGCKLEDVNKMEVTLCTDLNWKLHVDSGQFIEHQSRLASPSF